MTRSFIIHDVSWMNIGTIYQDRGEPKKALECYEGLLLYLPTYTRAWVEKAKMHFWLDDYLNSHDSLMTAHNLDPDYYDAWVLHGQLYEHLMQLKEALECYNQALRISDEDIQIRARKRILMNKLK